MNHDFLFSLFRSVCRKIVDTHTHKHVHTRGWFSLCICWIQCTHAALLWWTKDRVNFLFPESCTITRLLLTPFYLKDVYFKYSRKAQTTGRDTFKQLKRAALKWSVINCHRPNSIKECSSAHLSASDFLKVFKIKNPIQHHIIYRVYFLLRDSGVVSRWIPLKLIPSFVF